MLTCRARCINTSVLRNSHIPKVMKQFAPGMSNIKMEGVGTLCSPNSPGWQEASEHAACYDHCWGLCPCGQVWGEPLSEHTGSFHLLTTHRWPWDPGNWGAWVEGHPAPAQQNSGPPEANSRRKWGASPFSQMPGSSPVPGIPALQPMWAR